MASPKKTLRQLHWLVPSGLIFIVILITLLVAFATEQAVIANVKNRLQNTLIFQTATLKASMDKYAVLSALTARRPDVIALLKNNDIHESLTEITQLTTTFAGLSGASDIWVANLNGNILISNNSAHRHINIISENYFSTAVQGSLGRGSIVTDEGRRLYIFASPVLNGNKVIGVVIVRVDLEYLEQVWVLLSDPMLAIDKTGRILMSSIQSWRSKFFYNAGGEVEADNYLVEQFYNDTTRTKLLLNYALDDISGRRYLQVSQYVPLLEWNIHAMTNYDEILLQRNIAVFIALLIQTVIIMGVILWSSRQKQMTQEKRAQQAFALRLERQVRDRTHELTSANEKLEVEVEERKIAEQSLRAAQEELVQAAKLATIGQMSTALAHEYNQPLTAIRSYAENAIAFLEKDKLQQTEDNLERINMLVDKMANLTSTLRNFAHKSSQKFEAISLQSVMDEMVILLTPQAKKQQVTLEFVPASESVFILAEQGRLSQVITNLITNAMDAVAHSEERNVKVLWYKEYNKAIIQVKDTGPGILPEMEDKIFNAFFTTKGPGAGLGLGLFIVINIINDLKGKLTLKSESGYGAVFEIEFSLAE